MNLSDILQMNICNLLKTFPKRNHYNYNLSKHGKQNIINKNALCIFWTYWCGSKDEYNYSKEGGADLFDQRASGRLWLAVVSQQEHQLWSRAVLGKGWDAVFFLEENSPTHQILERSLGDLAQTVFQFRLRGFDPKMPWQRLLAHGWLKIKYCMRPVKRLYVMYAFRCF